MRIYIYNYIYILLYIYKYTYYYIYNIYIFITIYHIASPRCISHCSTAGVFQHCQVTEANAGSSQGLFTPQKWSFSMGEKRGFYKKEILGMEWSYHFLKIYLDVFRQFEATDTQKPQRWGCLTPWNLENKEWSTIWLTDVDCICCDRFARLLGVLFPPGERPPTKSTRMG